MAGGCCQIEDCAGVSASSVAGCEPFASAAIGAASVVNQSSNRAQSNGVADRRPIGRVGGRLAKLPGTTIDAVASCSPTLDGRYLPGVDHPHVLRYSRRSVCDDSSAVPDWTSRCAVGALAMELDMPVSKPSVSPTDHLFFVQNFSRIHTRAERLWYRTSLSLRFSIDQAAQTTLGGHITCRMTTRRFLNYRRKRRYSQERSNTPGPRR